MPGLIGQQLVLGTDTGAGTAFILSHRDWVARNHDHADQSNPTLFIHSITDPDAQNNQWLSLSHNTVDAQFGTGVGGLAFTLEGQNDINFDHSAGGGNNILSIIPATTYNGVTHPTSLVVRSAHNSTGGTYPATSNAIEFQREGGQADIAIGEVDGSSNLWLKFLRSGTAAGITGANNTDINIQTAAGRSWKFRNAVGFYETNGVSTGGFYIRTAQGSSITEPIYSFATAVSGGTPDTNTGISYGGADRIGIVAGGEVVLDATATQLQLNEPGGTAFQRINSAGFQFRDTANLTVQVSGDSGYTGLDIGDSAGINRRLVINVFESTQSGIGLPSVAGVGIKHSLVIGSKDHLTALPKNFDHGDQTNPTLFIHSATDPDTDNTQWLSLYHDQTNAFLESPDPIKLKVATKEYIFNASGDFTVPGILTSNERIRVSNGGEIVELNVSGTLAQAFLGINAAAGRHLVFADGTYNAKDFDHAVQTHPTLFIHSAADPDVDNTEWISITAHDEVFSINQRALIRSGNRNIAFAPVDGTGAVEFLRASGGDSVAIFPNFPDAVQLATGYSVRFNGTGGVRWSSAGATNPHLAVASNVLLLTDYANADQNHDHAAQTNPTLFIHSATDPDINNTQWLSLTHDQTDGVISSGSGDIVLNAASSSVDILSAGNSFLNFAAASSGFIRKSGANVIQISPAIAIFQNMTFSSANLDMNGNTLILDTDADTSISATTDDKIDFTVGGNAVLDVGASVINVDGDLRVGLNRTLTVGGTGNSAALVGGGGIGQFLFSIGSDFDRSIIITDRSNIAKNHDHTLQAHPTLFVHSVTDPDVANDEWLSLHHNGIDSFLTNGASGGDVVLTVADSTRAIQCQFGVGGAVRTSFSSTILDLGANTGHTLQFSNADGTIKAASTFDLLFEVGGENLIHIDNNLKRTVSIGGVDPATEAFATAESALYVANTGFGNVRTALHGKGTAAVEHRISSGTGQAAIVWVRGVAEKWFLGQLGTSNDNFRLNNIVAGVFSLDIASSDGNVTWSTDSFDIQNTSAVSLFKVEDAADVTITTPDQVKWTVGSVDLLQMDTNTLNTLSVGGQALLTAPDTITNDTVAYFHKPSDNTEVVISTGAISQAARLVIRQGGAGGSSVIAHQFGAAGARWETGMQSAGVDYVIRNFVGTPNNVLTLVSANNNVTWRSDLMEFRDVAGALQWEILSTTGSNILDAATGKDLLIRHGGNDFIVYKDSTDVANIITVGGAVELRPNNTLTLTVSDTEIVSEVPITDRLPFEINLATSAAPNVITNSESGKLFNNVGIGAQNRQELPTAVGGLVYRFYNGDADGIRIDVASADEIYDGTGTGTNISTSTIGNYLELTAVDATRWVVTNVVGTWTLA